VPIDDPVRFTSSKQVGAYLGLTPNQIPGETDIDGRISKIGDAWARALYAAANIMLTKSLKGCTTFKSWAMKVARMKVARRSEDHKAIPISRANRPAEMAWGELLEVLDVRRRYSRSAPTQRPPRLSIFSALPMR
jgi:hypothetical protein